MSRTPKERGFEVLTIEFKPAVLERLRMDAAAEERSVGYLVRRIVDQHYYEIDQGRGDHWQQIGGKWVRHVPPSKSPAAMSLQPMVKKDEEPRE
ncbi:MAG TPA: hypothetical protein VOA88_01155 [Candidatus Dormibacteraeota bacterium]|nr:hypothetical protein [Candidatus Dormibacteraeota bacterium]